MKILKYLDFVNESMADPIVKPTVKPKVRPKKPVPFKRPKVTPKPKATIDEVIKRFLQEMNEEDKIELINKYGN